MSLLKDRVAIVTGGAQGIGSVYARALASEGAAVGVVDVREATSVVKAIESAGGHAFSVTAGIDTVVGAETMAKATEDRFGAIHILVNNAAIFGALEPRPFQEITAEEWDQVMGTNVRGSFLCTKAVVPTMQRQRYGRVINIASGTVFKGTPLLLHYVTSKGAIVAMTRALARELGEYGIAVNTLAPGFTLSESVLANTKQRELFTAPVIASRCFKRDQHPEDLVGALLFLASEASAFMTGQVLVVDGGSVLN